MNVHCRFRRFRFFLLAWVLMGLVPGFQIAGASIHDCRGLYSFTNSLASRWPEQPPLAAVGVTPSYGVETVGSGLSTVLNVPALGSSQSYQLINWARDNGSNIVGPCNRWTLAMDIRPTFPNATPYLAILQTNTANTDDGEVFLHANGSLYAEGTVVPAGTFTANTWQRLVITCDGNSSSGLTIRFFRNGVLVGTKVSAFNGNYSIGAKALLFTDNNNETNPASIGALAFWTEPLANGLFGSPSPTVPEFSWASMPAANALPGLNREVLFGSFKLTLPASGFLLGDGTVNLGSGAVAQPGYALTGNLPVKYVGGSLVYTGSTSLSLTNGPAYTLDNVRMTATGVTVGPAGASGNLKVDLPVGMGINTVETSRRVRNSFNLTGVNFGTNLDPPNLTINPSHFGGTDKMYLSLEEMPLRYEFTQITWAGGAFLCVGSNSEVQFHRAFARTKTKIWNTYANVVADPRHSNDDSFAYVASRNGDLIIDADTDGQAKIRNLDLLFTTADVTVGYTTHFPKGLPMRWSTGVASRLTITGGVRQANSYLYEALGVSVDMPREAPGKNCAGATNRNFQIFIPDHWLHTKDYGFRAPVQITNPGTIEWGAISSGVFAHKINTSISEGWMMIPGSKIKASEVAFVDIRQRPSALLLSGIGAVGNPDLSERPLSNGYTQGSADYAGLNFRIGNSTVQSTSVLAGTAVNYELRSTSKYYIRNSGITGIHEPRGVTGSGSYPINAILAGYNFGLTAVRLSFRDLINIDSGILGNLNLPPPAGLQDLRFKSLRFGPRGELLSAIPETQAPFRFSYWQTQVTPMAIHFALPDNTACPSPAASTLVMAVNAKLPALSEQSFSGNIGFKSNGHTVTPGDNMVLANGEAVTSRLRPSSQMTVKGPGSTTYRFTPIGSGAYLNDSTGALPDHGFIAIPGELDVPFFRDLRVLLQASADSGSAAGSELNIISGDVANFSFWDSASMTDPWNTGVPPLDGNGNVQKAVAKRVWIDVVNFQLPVTWDNGLRRFNTPYDPNLRGDMVLFNLPQRVNRLSPETAELSFGFRNANPNAETLNFARLVDSKSGEGDVLLQNINTALVGSGLTNAISNVKSFEQLLGDSLEEVLGAALEFVQWIAQRACHRWRLDHRDCRKANRARKRLHRPSGDRAHALEDRADRRSGERDRASKSGKHPEDGGGTRRFPDGTHRPHRRSQNAISGRSDANGAGAPAQRHDMENDSDGRGQKDVGHGFG
jgi:hypothetical protein